MVQRTDMSSPETSPRYSGLATFMGTPFSETVEGLDIALVGVPYDGGTSQPAGARHSPPAIRNMYESGRFNLHDHRLGLEEVLQLLLAHVLTQPRVLVAAEGHGYVHRIVGIH